jgi:Xaa-Pro dipeptidase
MSTNGAGPVFPREEYHRRLEFLRREMAVCGFDAILLFAPANVFYLTGYATAAFSNYQCLVVPSGAPPWLIIRLLERPVAEATTGLSTIETFEDHEEPAEAVRRALSRAGLLDRRLGAERTSPLLTVRSYQRLEALLEVSFGDASGLVERGRAVKSPHEIECLRSAARCTEAGMRAALEAVAAGRTENDVAAAAYAAMIGAGGEFFSSQPIITSGPKSGVAHTTFQRRALRPGDPVLLEMGAVWNRYTAPLMRTAVVGEPAPGVRRMFDACREALEATIAAVRPGARSQDVQAACQGVIDRLGYEPNFRKRVGYSVGVGFGPGWGEGHIFDVKHHDERPLRPGMVLHLVPAMRESGAFGAGLSETVVVTDTGVEVLTSFPRTLAVR